MPPKQGDVFRAELDSGGGEHMVVVVSANRFNAASHSLMIIPFTSDEDGNRAAYQATAQFKAKCYPFLMHDSAVPAEWMEWIVRKRLAQKLGELSAHDLNRVLKAVASFFEIEVWIDAEE